MGFYATGMFAKTDVSRRSLLAKPDVPPKNRVRGFCDPRAIRARLTTPQVLETVSANTVTLTITVSGRPNGNISDYVDTNGVVVAHREFDPYGNTINATGSMVNDFSFWFSTKYLDQETDLYYDDHRFYSPHFGRFLSRDPIDEAGGYNLYGFCLNRPVDAIDPFGLERLRLVYDMDAELSMKEKEKNDPSGTLFLTKWREVIADMSRRVGDYDSKCNCIADLTLAGHGKAGMLDLGDIMFSVSLYEQYNTTAQMREQRGLPKTGPLSEETFLRTIGALLCQDKARVEFVTCRSGAGEQGQKLGQYLHGFFGQNVEIVLHSVSAGYMGGRIYERWWEYPLWFLF